jgi:serine/threonine-protein kinase
MDGDSTQDSTQPSFPTYAELTQTKAWAGEPPPIANTLPQPKAEDPRRAHRYTENAVLGVGGMGKVLLARDERIGRDVAVKVLRNEYELTDEEKARFVREAQVQGQLEHPAIVPVYDIDERPDGETFFTMRRVLGRTLHAILEDLRNEVPEAKARFTQRELLQAFATVCLSIDYAHTRGVVHRDLKPANIMLGDYGEVYVLDWGVARVLDPNTTQPSAGRLSRPGSMLGTPLYMAPEQMADPDVLRTADVWSLGAILFELLTLQRLRDHRALYAPVDARPSVRAPELAIAPELEQICVKATQLDAADRYPTARALQEAIARYLEGDRETELRRQRAKDHADRARAAMRAAEEPGSDYEKERGTAMRELARALAFDPTQGDHVAMFAEVLSKPPRTIPPEVHRRVEAMHDEVARSGVSHSRYAMLSWYAFFPLVILAGIRRWDYVLAMTIPISLAVLLGFWMMRRPRLGLAGQAAMAACLMLATVGLSGVYGPLILMPTVTATWMISVQVHPDLRMRVFALVGGVIVIGLPALLETAGVLPESYRFTAEGWVVLPQMIEIPANVTVPFLIIASIATAVVPTVLVARLRSQLSDMMMQQQLQTWHFRRLGKELVGT